MSAPLWGLPSGTLIARALKADILRETGLSASAGVSQKKFLAKLALDMNKPGGLTVIRPENASAVIAALPLKALHGIRSATEARFKKRGVLTGADLARNPQPLLFTEGGEQVEGFRD